MVFTCDNVGTGEGCSVAPLFRAVRLECEASASPSRGIWSAKLQLRFYEAPPSTDQALQRASQSDGPAAAPSPLRGRGAGVRGEQLKSLPPRPLILHPSSLILPLRVPRSGRARPPRPDPRTPAADRASATDRALQRASLSARPAAHGAQASGLHTLAGLRPACFPRPPTPFCDDGCHGQARLPPPSPSFAKSGIVRAPKPSPRMSVSRICRVGRWRPIFRPAQEGKGEGQTIGVLST